MFWAGCVFLALMLAGRCEGAVNTSTVEQYVSVLVSREMIPPETVKSPFIGLLYMTISEPPNRRLSWVLWHSIDFAETATVRGPANDTAVGSLIFELAPSGDATSRNCPFTGEIPVSETLVDLFHAGMAYAEVESGGKPQGQIRGHIRARDNVYFALSGDTFNVTDPDGNVTMGNTTGMAVINLWDVGQNPRDAFSQLGMDFWILTRRGGGEIFLGTTEGNVTVTFGFPDLILPALFQRTDTEIDPLNKTGILQGSIFVAEPLYGPGSSALTLVMQENGINLELGPFLRLPNPTRREFGSGPDGNDPSPASTSSPSLGVIALIVVMMVFQ